MLTLFHAPGTCSLASHIALEESGSSYESKRLNIAENEQRNRMTDRSAVKKILALQTT